MEAFLASSWGVRPFDLTRRWGGQSHIILGFPCWGSDVALWVEVGLGAVS